MKLIEQFIPEFPKLPYRRGSGAYEGVVAHATASYAPAKNEIAYMQRLWQEWIAAGKPDGRTPAFVQFFADWTGSYYIADVSYKAYGAGAVANQRYVHVELCQTRDPEQFKASYRNWIETLAWVLKNKRLGVRDGQTLVSHDWVSRNLGGTNHTDPIGYLAEWGVSWNDVVRDVTLAYEGQLDKPKGGSRVLEWTTDQWGMYAKSLHAAYEKRLIGDYTWVEKASSGTLTVDEAIWLQGIIFIRSQGVDVG